MAHPTISKNCLNQPLVLVERDAIQMLHALSTLTCYITQRPRRMEMLDENTAKSPKTKRRGEAVCTKGFPDKVQIVMCRRKA